MSVQIDGKTVKASVKLEIVPSLSRSEEFTVDGYKRVIIPFGVYRRWTLECVEDKSITWANSIISYLYDKCKSCSPVTLSVSTDVYSFNGQVYISSIDVEFDENNRIFTVTLEEKM